MIPALLAALGGGGGLAGLLGKLGMGAAAAGAPAAAGAVGSALPAAAGAAAPAMAAPAAGGSFLSGLGKSIAPNAMAGYGKSGLLGAVGGGMGGEVPQVQQAEIMQSQPIQRGRYQRRFNGLLG